VIASKPKPDRRNCRRCMHMTRVATCTEPVAAGLADVFEIAWPSAGHASTCPAFKPARRAAGPTTAATPHSNEVPTL
jgi:hypothetical protein